MLQASAWLDTLPRIRLSSNWKVRDLRPKQFLILGAGTHVDEIAAHVAATARHESAEPTSTAARIKVGLAAEVGQAPDGIRVVRILAGEGNAHFTATDVIFRRQGQDLFLKQDIVSRTWIVALSWIITMTVFVVVWCVLFGFYFRATDAREALVREFTNKQRSGFGAAEAMVAGIQVDPMKNEFVRGAPVTIGDVAKRDPVLFLRSMAGPPALIAAAIGGLLAGVRFGAPRLLTNVPCALVGWPSPEEFNAFIAGHNAWVDGVLGRVLERFGIDERSKVPVMS